MEAETSSEDVVDPNNMNKEIYYFIENLEEAISKDYTIDVKYNRVMICGMGGSAIGGDIIEDCVFSSMEVPVTVQRFPEIPHWADENTLAIVSSYSGNTKETLAMYNAVIKRKCTVIVITSGGQIKELAEKNGNIIFTIPPGIQPRSALGYILGNMAGIIEAVGGPKLKEQIAKAIPKLIRFREKLVCDRSVAWNVAKKIHRKTPIIYATPGITSSALRWKNQINENSKMIAFAGVVPEFNHNEIAGWSENINTDMGCKPIFLYEEFADKNIRKTTDAAISMLKKYEADPLIIKIRGKTIMERCLRATMFGDYVSLYLAYMGGVDPSEILTIKAFKARIENPKIKKSGFLKK